MQRTPAILLQDIQCALEPLIQEQGGSLDVVGTLEEALTLAGNAPNNWRVILNYDGYGAHSHAREGMSTVRFTTILQMDTGLAADPGARIYKESVSGKLSFLSRVELLSAWMRALRWPDGTNVACEGLVLEDSEWVANSPEKVTAQALSWSLDIALPAFTQSIVIGI